MKRPSRSVVATTMIALSCAVTILVLVFLLAQNRKLNEQSNKLIEEVKTQNTIIKEQTDINQAYLRCILLIEREKFQNPETRVDAIDKCARESKTPAGNPTGEQPTQQQIQDTQQQQPRSSAPVQQRSITNPQSASPTNQTSSRSQPVAQAPPQPEPQPSIIQTITRPVTSLLERL